MAEQVDQADGIGELRGSNRAVGVVGAFGHPAGGSGSSHEDADQQSVRA